MNKIMSRHITGHTSSIRFLMLAAVSVAVVALVSACSSAKKAETPTVYRANIHALNAELTGLEPTGTATLTLTKDSVRIQVHVEHLAPMMMHMMHIHGFPDGTQATCPTTMQDGNKDNIIDDSEAETSTGPPMIPLNGNPTLMEMSAMTYPTADSSGMVTYDRTISLSALKKAMTTTHQIASLDFDKRVIMIHGMAADSTLPETVMSPPDIPATTTVPVACGMFEKVTPPESE